MFVQNLSAVQQGALLATSKLLMASDGIIAPEEQKMLDQLRLQFTADVIESAVFDLSNLKGLFNSKRERSSFLLELIGMAFSDSEYHEDENKLIAEVASILDVDHNDLLAMESWVEKQLELSQAVNGFMGE